MSDLGTVVVVFGGALSAPESCYSLIDAGFSVVAICRENVACGIRKSKSISSVDVVAPEVDREKCLQEIIAAVNDHAAVAILPLDDTGLWLIDHGRSQFSCPIVIPSADAVTTALDKRLQILAASKAGFNVPRTAQSSDSFDSWNSFPSIVKGSLACKATDTGIGKSTVYFCQNDSELRATGFQFVSDNSMILQEWHHGTGVGIFGIRTESGIFGWSAHHRIRMMNPAGSGSSCCESEVPSEATRHLIERFLEIIDWKGIFMIELLRDQSGVEWFMEINGRTWGSTALGRAQGLEFPAWAVMNTLQMDPEIPKEAQSDTVTARHLGRECIHWLYVMKGRGRHRGMAWPSRLKTTYELLFSTPKSHWYNFRKKDVSVFWSDTLHCIKSHIKRSRPQ